jgi:thymidylate kinase
MRIVVEGPDKCGKTTYCKTMDESFLHLPNEPYRSLLLDGVITGTASTFVFFANTQELWDNPPESFYLDRDVVSMIAYQGILLGNMNPIVILNLYKSVVYKSNKPDKIIYLKNEPFEEYDKDDIFESFGYAAIRAAYEEAIKLVKLNLDIEIEEVWL